MYKLSALNDFGQQVSVIEIDKMLHIPFDPANTDYQEYLKWLEEGNTPLPAETE